MQDIFKKVYRMSLISSILFLMFGILLIVKPDNVMKTISIVIGIILLVIGIFPIVNYFRNRNQSIFSNAGLLYGIFSAVAGLLLIINNKLLGSIIPVLTGVWLIINSVNKIQLSMEIRDQKIKSWLLSFILAAFMLIGGSMLIINPFGAAKIAGRIVGIIIVIYSISDIADSIYIKVSVKNVINSGKNIVVIEEEKNEP